MAGASQRGISTHSFAWSPCGCWLAIALYQEERVRVINVTQPEAELISIPGKFVQVLWSDSGARLVCMLASGMSKLRGLAVVISFGR